MVEINRRLLIVGGAALVLTTGSAMAAEPDLRRLGLAKPPLAIEAPELNIPDLSGENHRVEDYRGKTVVVSFWATWCPPCRKEMPTLANLSRQLDPQDYAVLAVNVGDPKDKVKSFLDQIDHDGLPVLLDMKSELPSKWFIRGLPVTYVLNGRGEVVYGAIGERVWDAPEMISGLRLIS